MLCHLKFVSIYLSRYLCYPFGQTKRQWIFLSPKFLVFWTVSRYLFVGGGVQCWEKQWIFLSPRFFFSQDISLLVWRGVQNQRGLFVFWVCVSRYLFVVGGVQNQKRLFVIVFCVSIYLFVGVVFKTRGGFLLSLPATWDEPLFLPANGPIVQGAFRKYWNIEDDFDEIFKAHWKGQNE